jgi:hypothetical protein
VSTVTRRYDHPVRDRADVRVGAPVDVRVDGGVEHESCSPSQFIWRGRLYVVRGVLAHWVEVGAWWRARLPDGLPARVDEHGRVTERFQRRTIQRVHRQIFIDQSALNI